MLDEYYHSRQAQGGAVPARIPQPMGGAVAVSRADDSLDEMAREVRKRLGTAEGVSA